MFLKICWIDCAWLAKNIQPTDASINLQRPSCFFGPLDALEPSSDQLASADDVEALEVVPLSWPSLDGRTAVDGFHCVDGDMGFNLQVLQVPLAAGLENKRPPHGPGLRIRLCRKCGDAYGRS